MKHSVTLWLSDTLLSSETPTILIDSQAMIEHSLFSELNWLIPEMIFLLFSVYNAV